MKVSVVARGAEWFNPPNHKLLSNAIYDAISFSIRCSPVSSEGQRISLDLVSHLPSPIQFKIPPYMSVGIRYLC